MTNVKFAMILALWNSRIESRISQATNTLLLFMHTFKPLSRPSRYNNLIRVTSLIQAIRNNPHQPPLKPPYSVSLSVPTSSQRIERSLFHQQGSPYTFSNITDFNSRRYSQRKKSPKSNLEPFRPALSRCKADAATSEKRTRSIELKGISLACVVRMVGWIGWMGGRFGSDWW